ncbi:hypothetical protein [Promicromonospora sp. NPDC090134]|uniref:hypothetical protein n=1 Tax=Promicromonospora sp. NPDC090134 TaxID=3364408 RepID=UPI003808C193
MDEIQGRGQNPLTVVERSLQCALDQALPSASPWAGSGWAGSGWADSGGAGSGHAESGAGPSLGATSISLGWAPLPLDDKGTMPEVIVTWTGHGTAGRTPADDTARTSAVSAASSASTSTTTPTSSYGPGVSSARADRLAADALDMPDLPDATESVELPTGAVSMDDLPVGPALVALLSRVEVADTDDADLIDVAARWQDLISWATAMQSRATGEIARRRGWTTEHNTAAAEISARLHIPQTDANKLMARGTSLAEHPQVMNALHHAKIDTTKADILLHSGNPLTTEERDQAITLYLPQAPDRTRRWLREGPDPGSWTR